MDVRPLTVAALLGCQPGGPPPKRVVLVFVDTLRPDHMGTYGYARPTTPRLDEWARGAAVFTDARSVAPWTLPSTRAALSGRQPEAWGDGPVLMERLSEAGWATGAVTANVFLSEADDIGRGVDTFRYDLLAPAPDQVAQALSFLDAHPRQDAAVLVHLIDPHLPYAEPEPYRSRWAEPPPVPLPDGVLRGGILDRVPAPGHPDFAPTRQHLIDRYDQNIRFVDDALAPLWAALGPQDVAVVFSDHGEEFWEHGGFEHGHALYDEVVRVPLLIRGPGVSAGRVGAPASLLDVTPTVLALAGLEPGKLAGRDLLAGGPPPPPLAIGRTLYGRDAWAVVEGSTKWLRSPRETVRFDLGADPGEQAPLPAEAAELLAPLRASGVGAVSAVWRLELEGSDKIAHFPGTVTVQQAGGFVAAWNGHDPHGRLSAPQVDGAVVSVEKVGDRLFPGEVFLLPSTGGAATLTLSPQGAPPLRVSGELPLEASSGPHTVRLVSDVAVQPRPGPAPGFGRGLLEGLRELGYIE